MRANRFFATVHYMDFRLRKYQYAAGGVVVIATTAAVFYFSGIGERYTMTGFISEKNEEQGKSDLVSADDLQQAASKPISPVQQGVLPRYGGEPVRILNPNPNSAASVGAALVDKYQKNLNAIADRLENNPSNADDWLAVAYIKKLFGNITGARDAWEYAKIVNPENAVVYFNLGELYGYELNDPVKAEENYRSALGLDPYHLDFYIGAANFYEDVLKSLEKAEGIMLSALEKIPKTEVNLFTEIGAFYRDQKNYAKALEYFEQALAVAADPAVRHAVQSEIDYIRSKQ